MTGSYWATRLQRHLLLALFSAAMTGVVFALTPPPDMRHRFSMGTAYAATAMLVWTMSLGPWNLLRRRQNPVSFDLRRDIGIWAGILAVLHTAIGLTVHLHGRMWMYFLRKLHPVRLQTGEFGWANWMGGISALLMILLLLISNDLSVRRLGLRRWKWLQRTTYVATALALAHGVLFQLLETRHWPWVVLFACLGLAILAAQGIGLLRHRRKELLPATARREVSLR